MAHQQRVEQGAFPSAESRPGRPAPARSSRTRRAASGRHKSVSAWRRAPRHGGDRRRASPRIGTRRGGQAVHLAHRPKRRWRRRRPVGEAADQLRPAHRIVGGGAARAAASASANLPSRSSASAFEIGGSRRPRAAASPRQARPARRSSRLPRSSSRPALQAAARPGRAAARFERRSRPRRSGQAQPSARSSRRAGASSSAASAAAPRRRR